MPKKLSTNPKAQAARDRKEEKKKAERERMEKEKEDALWVDEDKLNERKQQRKDLKEQKKNETLQKKAEKKQLLEQEEAEHGTVAAPVAKKVTQAEISERQAKTKKIKEKEQAESAASEGSAELFEGENPNRKMAELLAEEGAVEARSVDEAISVLSIGNQKVDRHPEKRLKAAYLDFEKKELPRVKKENPKLRLSQLKQVLWKEWMKSPENPSNQLSQT